MKEISRSKRPFCKSSNRHAGVHSPSTTGPNVSLHKVLSTFYLQQDTQRVVEVHARECIYIQSDTVSCTQKQMSRPTRKLTSLVESKTYKVFVEIPSGTPGTLKEAQERQAYTVDMIGLGSATLFYKLITQNPGDLRPVPLLCSTVQHWTPTRYTWPCAE